MRRWHRSSAGHGAADDRGRLPALRWDSTVTTARAGIVRSGCFTLTMVIPEPHDNAWHTALWAKSDAGGQAHSLIGHLMDTAAVAELVWDEFLAPKTRQQLDAAAQGRGRDLLVLLAGWHDLGKATPAFQSKADTAKLRALIAGLQPAGLIIPARRQGFAAWPHGTAGAVIVQQQLVRREITGGEWLAPVIAGHHGLFPGRPARLAVVKDAHGTGPWILAQQSLADLVTERFGIELDHWSFERPTRGVQLALNGFVVMCDWIASSKLFPGIGLHDMDAVHARARARSAWHQLGLRNRWPDAEPIAYEQRFGMPPRPFQQAVMDAVDEHPDDGLWILEAPMGEGKTEAALLLAEHLAARQGCNGMIFAMPTQGTTDAMHARVTSWARSFAPDAPVSLLHGKRMLNEPFRKLVESLASPIGDEFGLPEIYGDTHGDLDGARSLDWLMGRHRGLLSTISVGTIDQVLQAATRTRYVALRHAGLAGRVLVIDEVHSYDVHMGVFLLELLRWCGRLGTPVVLMSATLAPELRQNLVDAWHQGAETSPPKVPETQAHPSVLSFRRSSAAHARTAEPRHADRAVRIEVLPTDDLDDVSPIARAVDSDTASGGCALVILNTVRRAQQTFVGLRDAGVPAMLLHGRLTAATRAQRTEEALHRLGDENRTSRFVVVATQIAEQSFDVDADVLYTDLAPVDLLAQRIGRLHRHGANDAQRPAHLRKPRVVITGLRRDGALPQWPASFATPAGPVRTAVRARDIRPRTVYRPHALLQAAAQLDDGDDAVITWTIPGEVPSRVARAYSGEWQGPDAWLSAVQAARDIEDAEAASRRAHAATWRLDEHVDNNQPDLWNLHARHGTDDFGRPIVRDGDDSLEVVLVRRDIDGLACLGGNPLGPEGERAHSPECAREVLGDSVRLRWRPALAAVRPLPVWANHPLLMHMPVLELDAEGRFDIGGWRGRYDSELGLVDDADQPQQPR